MKLLKLDQFSDESQVWYFVKGFEVTIFKSEVYISQEEATLAAMVLGLGQDGALR